MVGVCSPFSGSSGVFYGDEEFVKNTTNSGNSCAYDANGNRLYDSNSNIWGINYNLLNLPDAMQFYQGHQTIYTYSATGAKLKVVDKTAPEGVILPVTSLNTVLSNPSVSTITTTDYVGNVIYENGTLKRILTPEGYWQDGTYYYFLKDHLGSNRVVINSSGGIAETSSYYPSGMRFGESAVNGGSVQPYRHTGHEMQSMHGLNWIDNGARFRTVNDGGGLPTVDPLAEDYYETSPYAYCQNNPVNKIDPDGRGVNDVNPLPEVTVTAKKNDPVGTRAMDPVSGFWGWVGYFAFDRTYRSGENSNGKFPVIKATWNVNSQGVITSVVPLTGTVDVGIAGEVGSYLELTKLAKGLKGGSEAHHILEVRHLKRLFKSTSKAPAVLLTKAEHLAFTNELRQALPYGKVYQPQEIIEAYKKVYASQPEWLKAAINYLTH